VVHQPEDGLDPALDVEVVVDVGLGQGELGRRQNILRSAPGWLMTSVKRSGRPGSAPHTVPSHNRTAKSRGR